MDSSLAEKETDRAHSVTLPPEGARTQVYCMFQLCEFSLGDFIYLFVFLNI